MRDESMADKWSRRIAVACTAVVITGMMAVSAVSAQPAPAPGGGGAAPPHDTMTQARQLQQEIMQLQQKLGAIQEKAIAEHPELQQEQEDFRDLVVETMKEQGNTPEEDLAELQDMQSRLQDESVAPDERQKLSQEFRQKDMKFRQAQQEAMEDGEVQEAQKAFNDDMVEAMKEQDPQTEELLTQFIQKQQKLMELRQSAMGGHRQ